MELRTYPDVRERIDNDTTGIDYSVDPYDPTQRPEIKQWEERPLEGPDSEA
jgi:hypothetical protein